jgi:hypothetical protein
VTSNPRSRKSSAQPTRSSRPKMPSALRA